MAITFNITVGQISGGAWIPTTGLTQLNLRASPYAVATFTMDAEIGTTGVYRFLNVVSGEYKLYNNTSELSNFGIIKVGEDGAVLLTGNQTIAGTKTFSSQVVLSSGVQTDTISEKTAASGVTIDGILLKDSLDVSSIVAKSGNQTIAGDKTFTGTSTLGNVSITGDVTLDTGSTINIPDAPTTGNHATNKTYVDAQVASISVIPYQFGDNERYVISNGTVQTNKVYTAIQTAIDSCSSPAIDNIFLIHLKRGDSVSSTADNIFYLSHAELENHVNIIGSGVMTRLVLGTTGASVTKIMTIENCAIWLGANDITTDRVYNSFTFRNCVIYAYKNLTLTNCKIDNCKILQPSGFGVTLTGSCEISGAYFSQSVNAAAASGLITYTDSLSTSYSMPNDLSLAP